MKNSLKKALSLVALGAVAISAASMNAFAEGEDEASRFSADGGFSAEQIANSTVKPTLTATKKVIELGDAKDAQTIDITVTGADAKYAATGFHIYYDKRLTIPVDDEGDPDVTVGAGGAKLTVKVPDPDPTAVTYDSAMNGIFVCSSSDKNRGKDGVVWTFDVILPADAAEGDVYPIDLVYRSNKTNEDLFVNVTKDEEGRLMQAYTFTQGIYNRDTNNAFKASAEDIELCPALEDIKGEYDGYIAIAGGKKEQPTNAPTEAPTEAPTNAPTNAPTEAPTEAPTNAPTQGGTEAPTQGGTQAPATGVVTSTTRSGNAGGDNDKTTTTASKNNGNGGKSTSTTGKKDDSPKTGVAGVGVAVAGLAVALGTAFVLRKKED